MVLSPQERALLLIGGTLVRVWTEAHFWSLVYNFSLAIFLPPLGVFLERGCGADFWISKPSVMIPCVVNLHPVLTVCRLVSQTFC